MSSSTPKKDDASLAVGASAESNNTQKRVLGADLKDDTNERIHRPFLMALELTTLARATEFFLFLFMGITEMPTRMSYELDKFLSLEEPSKNFFLARRAGTSLRPT